MNYGILLKLAFCIGVVGASLNWHLLSNKSPDSHLLQHQTRTIQEISQPRRPVALVFSDDDKHLMVANRDTGTISVIALGTQKIIFEKQIGEELSDLVRVGKRFFATDFAKHQLISFEWKPDPDQSQLLQVSKTSTIKYPMQIAVSENGEICVAGLWSQQLQIFKSVDESGKLESVKRLQLPFAPGSICWGTGENAHLIFVGSAFSAELTYCSIKASESEVKRRLQLPGTSIRDLKLSRDGKKLVLVGQKLNKLARSTRNDIHWGLMVSNEIRTYQVASLLKHQSTPVRPAKTVGIGSDDNGKGDPESLIPIDKKQIAIALAGVHQVAIRDQTTNRIDYVSVNKGPTDLALATSKEWLAAANMFSDSITLIHLESQKPNHISLGKSKALTAAQRGEQLFFDATLSHDGWLSCGSCHVRGHTNGMLNDNASDGSFDAPKLVISTLGRANTAPFAWNGNIKTLAQQVENSIEKTMQSDEPADKQQVSDIVAYLKQLPSPPSLEGARADSDESLKKTAGDGKKLFAELGCGDCHSGKSFTSQKIVDVGLVDEVGARKFNPPSLLGVSQRTSYLHDGRAKSLEQLFDELKHQLPRKLSQKQRNSLVRFLKTL